MAKVPNPPPSKWKTSREKFQDGTAFEPPPGYRRPPPPPLPPRASVQESGTGRRGSSLQSKAGKLPAQLANGRHHSDPGTRFRPGFGQSPPLLSGREREQSDIAWELKGIAEGAPATSHIALIGPRGNGKTALLGWVADETLELGSHGAECLQLTGGSFASADGLVLNLARPEWLRRGSAPSVLMAIEDIASQLFAGASLSAGSECVAERLIGPVLERRAREKLVLLVDEAHIMGRYQDTVRKFFNAVQIVSRKHPLLLILAGTPDLATKLNVPDATFWSRLRKIGIGRLSEDASREALRKPLARMGYGIAEDALDRSVDVAQRYPFFLQLVGAALSRAAIDQPDDLEPERVIGLVIANSAFESSRIQRTAYCEERYDELRAAALVPAAEAVAKLFAGQENRKVVPVGKVEAAVAEAVDDDIKAEAEAAGARDPALWAQRELHNLGFIWSRIGGAHECEPGIPSLMDYVLWRAKIAAADK